jgi:prepilin-type N-terminal cleavage/methylation domain-containing protein
MLTGLTLLKRQRAGFTLAEFLVSMLVAGIIVAQVCLLWFYSSRSFAAQMSYVDMDQASQRALDILTREIRQVKSLTSYATNQLVFKDFDDQALTYRFDGKYLFRIKGMTRRVLLKDCETGGFAIFQRTPIEGSFKYYPTDTPATCKLVEIRWMCARHLFPSAPLTRESMHSAKIVVRANES